MQAVEEEGGSGAKPGQVAQTKKTDGGRYQTWRNVLQHSQNPGQTREWLCRCAHFMEEKNQGGVGQGPEVTLCGGLGETSQADNGHGDKDGGLGWRTTAEVIMAPVLTCFYCCDVDRD